jgi:hypothetical protein
MWSMLPVVAIVIAQGQPSSAEKWCFERDQDAQLCEHSEAACKALLDINGEIARSPCKRVQEQPPTSPNKQPSSEPKV